MPTPFFLTFIIARNYHYLRSLYASHQRRGRSLALRNLPSLIDFADETFVLQLGDKTSVNEILDL